MSVTEVGVDGTDQISIVTEAKVGGICQTSTSIVTEVGMGWTDQISIGTEVGVSVTEVVVHGT